MTANVIFFRLLFYADARPTNPMFFTINVQWLQTCSQPSFAPWKTNFPSEERVTFTGNLFEMINNLIFEILYTTQSKIHTNLYLSLINRCLQIGKLIILPKWKTLFHFSCFFTFNLELIFLINWYIVIYVCCFLIGLILALSLSV